MNELTQDQKDELVKCANSFHHFATQWVKIIHPKRGLIPFDLYDYQRRLIDHYENNRLTILTKFRQGGFTTTTLFYALWKCMFSQDQRILVLSKTDRESCMCSQILRKIIEYMPDWMQPSKEGKWNDHRLEFKETNSDIAFLTPEASRGRGCSLLVIDEAAFFRNMKQHWKAMYPCISCGGNVIVLSTPNGLGNWFEETYFAAKQKKNAFSIFWADYTEHPEYNNPDWATMFKEDLGEAGWQQEVLQNFVAPQYND